MSWAMRLSFWASRCRDRSRASCSPSPAASIRRLTSRADVVRVCTNLSRSFPALARRLGGRDNRLALPVVAARFQLELIERADRRRRARRGRPAPAAGLPAPRCMAGGSAVAASGLARVEATGPASRAARSCGLRVGRVPDVHRLEVRAVRIGIADALHDRELPVFEQRCRSRAGAGCRPRSSSILSTSPSPTRQARPALAIDSRRLNGTTVFRPSLPPLSWTTTRIRSPCRLGAGRGRLGRESRARAARARPGRSTRRPRPRPGTCGGKWSAWRFSYCHSRLVLRVASGKLKLRQRAEQVQRLLQPRPGAVAARLIQTARPVARGRPSAAARQAAARQDNRRSASATSGRAGRGIARASRRRSAFRAFDQRPHQVRPAQERRGVDPRPAAVPAFDVRRIERHLAQLAQSARRAAPCWRRRRATAAGRRPARPASGPFGRSRRREKNSRLVKIISSTGATS